MISKDDWKQIEKELSGAYGTVELLIDGYEIILQVRWVGPRKFAIMTYVNGKFLAKWLSDDCEERRRFLCENKRYLWKPKTREAMRKLFKRYPKYYTSGDPAEFFRYYTPFWGSFSRLKAHLLKNNKSIEWVNRPAATQPAPQKEG